MARLRCWPTPRCGRKQRPGPPMSTCTQRRAHVAASLPYTGDVDIAPVESGVSCRATLQASMGPHRHSGMCCGCQFTATVCCMVWAAKLDWNAVLRNSNFDRACTLQDFAVAWQRASELGMLLSKPRPAATAQDTVTVAQVCLGQIHTTHGRFSCFLDPTLSERLQMYHSSVIHTWYSVLLSRSPFGLQVAVAVVAAGVLAAAAVWYGRRRRQGRGLFA